YRSPSRREGFLFGARFAEMERRTVSGTIFPHDARWMKEGLGRGQVESGWGRRSWISASGKERCAFPRRGREADFAFVIRDFEERSRTLVQGSDIVHPRRVGRNRRRISDLVVAQGRTTRRVRVVGGNHPGDVRRDRHLSVLS